MFGNRVKQEEFFNKRALEVDNNEDYSPDTDLHVTEGIIADLTRRIANTDRLVYIYTLTGIIIATVIITLIRSFIFFSVSTFNSYFMNFLSIMRIEYSILFNLKTACNEGVP